MNEISKYADLAEQILHNHTKYSSDKKIIKEIFSLTSKNYSEESIISRLTIIDSYYSTQMNKRYFGIEDVARMISGLSKNENEIKEMFRDFAVNQQNQNIKDLFNFNEYGISKEGNPFGKATSLISKYAYFQTDLKFPIYDKFAKETHPLIVNKYYLHENISTSNDNITNFIKNINRLNEITEINDYDKLDNLLWLTGKIISGNFSLILNKEQYCLLANNVSDKTEENTINKKGEAVKRDFSERIVEFFSNNYNQIKSLKIDSQLSKFIEFAFEL